jgi:hypothetical protein
VKGNSGPFAYGPEVAPAAPIDGGCVINFLAVIDGPERWTAPAWMEPAEPGAHLEALASWHPAVTEMLAAVPQSPRWGLFTRRPLARWNRGLVVLPDGPAARRRDAALSRLADDLAWIHGYDALAPATGRGARCSAAAG